MGNRNSKEIVGLREIIYNNLVPLINDDYSLLDIPYHNNIGDSLIYQGELEFLKLIEDKRLLYKSSAKFGRLEDIPRNGILLLHGGGNFGDIWKESHDFRRELINKRRNQKIILFPQTVHYNNLELIKNDIKIYNSHPDLTLCARDSVSFEFLKKYFVNCNVLLVPDMAFCLNLVSNNLNSKNSNLFLLRTDLETKGEEGLCLKYINDLCPGNELIIKDWPGMEHNSILKQMFFQKRNLLQNEVYCFLKRVNFDKYFINNIYGFGPKNKGIKLVRKGIDFLDPFQTIFTNRLHGMILCVLLGKEVICFDNSYGKNFNFYNSWLSNFDNCEFKKFS